MWEGGEKKITYLQRLATGVSTAALVASSFAPAVFAEELVIDGNGAHSNNTINVNNTCTVDVLQKNKTYSTVYANVTASTGGNEANGNTGVGGVEITTGNATASLDVYVGGSNNTASTPSCCECQQEASAAITGNGYSSDNNITQNNTANVTVTQRNRTRSKVRVNVKAKTGKNKANNNTGNGTVNTTTGDANASVNVTVNGSSNSL